MKATILPGLFVNTEPINYGKILVHTKIKFSNEIQ
jgi:hypothetical protein